MKVLDALSLEERFKKALPMLTRQIEGLKLLQKTRKMNPDNEKRVTSICVGPFSSNSACVLSVNPSVSHLFRCYQYVKVECFRAGSSIWMRRMKMTTEMTPRPWRGRSTGPTCPKLHSGFASKSSRGELSSFFLL